MSYLDGEEKRTVSLGSRLGCTSAFLFTLPVSFPFFFGMAWGGAHCDPVPECQREGQREFAMEMAAILFVALLIGLAIRWAVNKASARRIDGDATIGFVSGATVATLLVTAIAVWAMFTALEAFYLPAAE